MLGPLCSAFGTNNSYTFPAKVAASFIKTILVSKQRLDALDGVDKENNNCNVSNDIDNCNSNNINLDLIAIVAD